MAARLPDWERRLSEYLATPERDVFRWGVNDCALFACGAVEAMTGEHPDPRYLGRYDSREGAAKALRELGAGTLGGTFDDRFPSRPVSHARRGDLVMAMGAVGVCMGAFGVFLRQDAPGYAKLPRAMFERAWEV